MRLIFRHIRRNIAENKIRSIILFFSISVIAAILYFGLLLRNGIDIKYVNMVRSIYGDFDIRISEQSRGALEEIDTGALSVLKTAELTLPVDGSGISYAYVIGLNCEDAIEKNFLGEDVRLITGEMTAVITGEDAEKYNITAGQIISLPAYDGTEVKITIAGIVQNQGYLSAVLDTCRFLVSSETMQKIIPWAESGNYLYCDYEDSLIEEKYGELTEQHPLWSVVKLFDSGNVNEAVDFLYLMFYIFFAALVFIMFLIVYETTSYTLRDRMASFAVFQCCGAEISYISFIFIMENVLTSLAGCTLGVAVSVFVSDSLFTMFFSSTMEITETGPVFDIPMILVTYLIVILLDVLMLLPALLRIKRTPVIEQIQAKNCLTENVLPQAAAGIFLCLAAVLICVSGEDGSLFGGILSLFLIITGGCVLSVPCAYGANYLYEKFIVKKAGRKAGIAVKNNKNNEASLRNIRTFVVLTAVMALFFQSGRLFKNYIRSEREIIVSDVVVSEVTVSEEKITEALVSDDIEGYNLLFCSIQKDDSEQGEPIMCVAFSDVDTMDDFYCGPDQEKKAISCGELLVDESYFMKKGYTVGDRAVLEFADGKQVGFMIAGKCDLQSLGQGVNSVLMNYEDYRTYIGDIPTYIFLNTTDNFGIEAFREHFPDGLAKIMKSEDFIEDKAKFWKQLESFALYMLMGGMLLALSGIVVNRVITLYQRREEFAVYLSTCMDYDSVLKLVITEELFSGLTELILSGLLYIGEMMVIGKLFGMSDTGILADVPIVFLMIMGILLLLKGILVVYVGHYVRKIDIFYTLMHM